MKNLQSIIENFEKDKDQYIRQTIEEINKKY